MKKYLLNIVLLIFSLNAFPQKEAANWYFGDSAAITFNTTPTTSLTNSGMDAKNGCATISDANGVLLFYTNGIKVYNRNHQIMDNGDSLMGSKWGTQAAVIIPDIVTQNKYYIFTVHTPTPTGTGSFRYSIVDMSINNGLGKVVVKNVFIASGMIDKIAAVKHANNSSVWLMTHYDNSNGYAAFLFSKNGIDINPVQTYIGTTFNSNSLARGLGRMKFSPDGKVLVTPWYWFLKMDLLRFDNTTGKLSNPIIFNPIVSEAAEFSPNGKLLYCSNYVPPITYLYQFDISNYDSTTILNSKQLIYDGYQIYSSRGIQLGIDNKIYLTRGYYLDCIEFPNKRDTFCRYVDSAIYLSGNQCYTSLPDFLQSYFFKPDFEAIGTCFGDTSQFYVQDSTQVDSLYWIFNDSLSGANNFSSSWAPKHFFTDTGWYNVKMIVYHDSVADTSSREIRISPYPSANFTINDNAQCLASNYFEFTNTTNIASGSFSAEWHFGDGTVSYDTSTNHSYLNEDSFTVKMYALSDYGCLDSISQMVYVFPPKAEFEINSDTAQCLSGNHFIFINKTTNNFGIINYSWYFGDGDSSNLFDTAYHIYTNPDTFEVSLIASSNFGCADTLSKKAYIHPMPVANFSINNDSQCLNENYFEFNNQTAFPQPAGLSYTWNLGDSTTSTDTNTFKRYSASDTFKVSLLATSLEGCSDTNTKNVIVLESPKAKIVMLTDSIQCLNENNFSFFNPLDSTNPTGLSNWYFGDASTSDTDTAIHHFAFPDSFEVILIEETINNCFDTATKTVIVHPSPEAFFTINNSNQCLNENSFILTNLASCSEAISLNYLWDFGDNTASSDSNYIKTYYQVDTFDIQLKVTTVAGCSDSLLKQVVVLESPVSGFGINDSSQCFTTNSFNFWNLSASNSDSIVTHLWYLGDGNTSNGNLITHSYSLPDTFEVKLIVTTNSACSDTTFKKVYIHPVPIASFTINDTAQCQNENLFVCTDTTQFSYSKLKRSWELSDTSTYTSESIMHIFNSSNTYSIKLKLESEEGCIDSLIKQVNVFPSPETSFDINDTSQCFNENKFEFTNKSTISSGNISSQIWDMGNNDTLSSNDVVDYVYQIPDTALYVKLTTVSDQGCSHADSSKIYIHPIPKAAFTIDDPSQCLTENKFNFSNTSGISSGMSNYKWFLNDSLLGSSFQFNNLTIQQYGNYLIKLKATSEYQCIDSVEQSIFVNPMPTVRFTNSMPCLNNLVDFTNQSSIPVGNIAVYQWYFDLVKNSTLANTSYLFTTPGYHEAKLLVESDSGCIDSFRKDIYFYDHVDANTIERATVTENEQILVEWTGSNMGNPMSYKLARSTDSISFYELAVFDAKSSEYIDENVEVNSNSYIYRIQTIDSCGYGSPYSNIGKSILLKADESSEYTKLSWTPYQYWEEDVNVYEVQIFNKSLNDFVDLYSSKEAFEFEDNITNLNQATYCYRIKAIRNGDGLESFSNTVCVSIKLNVFVPNAFTPNGDGLNDEFEIKGTFIIDYKIMIFDRWEQLLFESDDIEKSWDGKFKNSLCPVGEYYYQVQVKGTSGNRDLINGTVSLIR